MSEQQQTIKIMPPSSRSRRSQNPQIQVSSPSKLVSVTKIQQTSPNNLSTLPTKLPEKNITIQSPVVDTSVISPQSTPTSTHQISNPVSNLEKNPISNPVSNPISTSANLEKNPLSNQAVNPVTTNPLLNQAVNQIATSSNLEKNPFNNQAVNPVTTNPLLNQAVNPVTTNPLLNQAVNPVSKNPLLNQAVNQITTSSNLEKNPFNNPVSKNPIANLEKNPLNNSVISQSYNSEKNPTSNLNANKTSKQVSNPLTYQLSNERLNQEKENENISGETSSLYPNCSNNLKIDRNITFVNEPISIPVPTYHQSTSSPVINDDSDKLDNEERIKRLCQNAGFNIREQYINKNYDMYANLDTDNQRNNDKKILTLINNNKNESEFNPIKVPTPIMRKTFQSLPTCQIPSYNIEECKIETKPNSKFTEIHILGSLPCAPFQ